jgi:cysteine synthase
VAIRLGAKVIIVPCCAISNEGHYVRVAAKLAKQLNGFYVNQFENLYNSEVHFDTTGPELFRQCDGQLDAFIMSAGTGGTISGISRLISLVSLYFFLSLISSLSLQIFETTVYLSKDTNRPC